MAELTFTEALEELQKSASEIGKQATTLEDSLKYFENGMKQAEFCSRILDEAEQQITVYEKRDQDA